MGNEARLAKHPSRLESQLQLRGISEVLNVDFHTIGTVVSSTIGDEMQPVALHSALCVRALGDPSSATILIGRLLVDIFDDIGRIRIEEAYRAMKINVFKDKIAITHEVKMQFLVPSDSPWVECASTSILLLDRVFPELRFA